MREYEIVAQAGIAVATLLPKITHALAKASPADRSECLRQIGEAAKHARELALRLDIAELECAAQPIPDAVGSVEAA